MEYQYQMKYVEVQALPGHSEEHIVFLPMRSFEPMGAPILTYQCCTHSKPDKQKNIHRDKY
jgi:hypothetical protein